MNIFPSIRTSTVQIIAIFRNRENIPKVTIFKGKVNISSMGLIAKLITPKANPAKAKEEKFPSKLTPGIPVASQIPRIPATICDIKLFIDAVILARNSFLVKKLDMFFLFNKM